MKKEQFRLVAIRPLQGCAEYIRKILKEGEHYFFYDGYEKSTEGIVRRKNNFEDIPNHFYVSKSKDTPLVSISAIVGKNGEGKSSIVELTMRVLNNFAYVAGYAEIHEGLHAIDDLRAELYYEIGTTIYKIVVEEDDVKLFRIDKNALTSIFEEKLSIATLEINKILIDKVTNSNPKSVAESLENIKGIQDILFYTQVINYSLYAYNSNELKKEVSKLSTLGDKIWIDGIFHKNDGYQTPIVLTPYRTKGCIDINKENGLSKSRLLELFINDCNIENETFRKVDNRFVATSLNLSIPHYAKLQYSFYSLCGSSMYRRGLEGIDRNLQSETIDVMEFTNAFVTFMEQMQNSYYYETLAHMNDVFYNDNSRFQSIHSNTQTIVDIINEDSLPTISDNKTVKRFKDFKKKNQEHRFPNLILLYRIAIYNYTREAWMKNIDLNKSIVTEPALREELLDYLVYKIISITEKYPTYKEFQIDTNIRGIGGYENFIKTATIFETDKINIDNAVKKILEDIKDNKSHITLKIRQALAFLYKSEIAKDKTLSHKKQKHSLTEGCISKYNIKLEDYYKKISPNIGTDCLIEEESIINKLTLQELLPPPIYDVEIMFIDTEDGASKDIELSDMSSGQRQLLYFVSSVLYHLKNLDSVPIEGELIKYSHINLLFEEVELYFHPEYQQKLINYFIQSLSAIKLSQIQSLNICFITHSPFILSDIPKQNILLLKEGKPQSREMNTFGANIVDLLANSFFLDKSLIGDFAFQKIRKVIKWLDNTEDKTDSNYYRNIIKLVDEPIVQRKLSEMYDKKMAESLEIELIDRQISYLEKLKKNASHKSQFNKNKKG